MTRCVATALAVVGSILALPAGAAVGDGGGGTYLATGRTYAFSLVNSGSTAWRSFSVVAPAGVSFVGGTTGNEGSATCVVGPPTEIACGPLAPSTMPPQAHIAFVATAGATAVCDVSFELFVSSDGTTSTRAADLTAAAGCGARAVTPPTLHGAAVVGSTIRATAPTWSPPPERVGYRWQRCTGSTCTPIAGATGLTLVLTRRDAGHTVRLVATATIAGQQVTTESRASDAVRSARRAARAGGRGR